MLCFTPGDNRTIGSTPVGRTWIFFFRVQWNPALQTPGYYGQFHLSPQKAHIFSLKLTRLIRTPVNMDNGHVSASRVTNSHTSSTPLYGHWLSAHCLFSLSFVLIFGIVPYSNNERFLQASAILFLKKSKIA